MHIVHADVLFLHPALDYLGQKISFLVTGSSEMEVISRRLKS